MTKRRKRLVGVAYISDVSRPGATMPEQRHPSDAGWDLYADEGRVIRPRGRVLVRTGLVLGLPAGVMALVLPRSGLALLEGVTVANAPGLIDPGYRGEVSVILANHGDRTVQVAAGERIAQLVFLPVLPVAMVATSLVRLRRTDRGTAGFGSTGGTPRGVAPTIKRRRA